MSIVELIISAVGNPSEFAEGFEQLEFLGNSDVLSTEEGNGVRVPNGKDGVKNAVEFLKGASANTLENTFGLGLAATDKFLNADASLSSRVQSHGYASGSVSDFVQVGTSGVSNFTIVALMIIDEQSRARLFAEDKTTIGVAESEGNVSVVLAAKFIPSNNLEDPKSKDAEAEEGKKATEIFLTLCQKEEPATPRGGQSNGEDAARRKNLASEQRQQKQQTEEERQKKLAEAEETRKARWQADRKNRAEKKAQEERERIEKIRNRNAAPNFSRGYSSQVASGRNEKEETQQADVVKGTVAGTGYVPTSHSVFGRDMEEEVPKIKTPKRDEIEGDEAEMSKEEARLMRSLMGGKSPRARIDIFGKDEPEYGKKEYTAEELEAKKAKFGKLEYDPLTNKQVLKSEGQAIKESVAEETAPEEEIPDFGLGGAVVPDKGDINEAYEALSAGGKIKLFLNALIREEESVELDALSEIREDVSYFAKSGHKVTRSSSYSVSVLDADEDPEKYKVQIPPVQMLDDDFNKVSDYFFFGSGDQITVFDATGEKTEVETLKDIEQDREYKLPSGNTFVLKSGSPPTLFVGGEKEIDLPEEALEGLE